MGFNGKLPTYTKAEIRNRYKLAHPERVKRQQKRYRKTKRYKRLAAAAGRRARKLKLYGWFYTPTIEILDHD